MAGKLKHLLQSSRLGSTFMEKKGEEITCLFDLNVDSFRTILETLRVDSREFEDFLYTGSSSMRGGGVHLPA